MDSHIADIERRTFEATMAAGANLAHLAALMRVEDHVDEAIAKDIRRGRAP